jgi:O-antigen/teichoic acid export membrane protein
VIPPGDPDRGPVATPEEPRPRHGFLRASAGIAASQYLARAVMLARGAVAAAVLGPYGYGIWNALNLIFDYGSYASLGAIQGLDVRLPAAVERGDMALARRLMAGALGATSIGAILFATGLVAGVAGERFLPGVPRLLPLLMLLAAVLQLLVLYFASCLRALGRFGAVSAGSAVQAVVGGGLGIALLGSLGLVGLLVGWIAGTLLALVVMKLRGPEIPLAPATSGAGVLVRVGLAIFAFYLASLVLRSVDRIALVRYASSEALGLYSVGLLASGLVLFVPESLAYVLFPRIAAAAAGTSDAAVMRGNVVRVQRALAVCLPLAVGIGMIWATPVIGLLLPAYAAGLPALRLLTLAALVLGTSTIPTYLLLGTGRRRRLLVAGGAAAASTALLVFFAAATKPQAENVAFAAGTGYALFALLMLGLAAHELRHEIAPARFFVASLLPALWGWFAAVLAAAQFGEDVAGTALASLVFITFYAPVLWLFIRGLGARALIDTLTRRA